MNGTLVEGSCQKMEGGRLVTLPGDAESHGDSLHGLPAVALGADRGWLPPVHLSPTRD